MIRAADLPVADIRVVDVFCRVVVIID